MTYNVREYEKITLDAIALANRRYAKWSGGLWLNDAGVESMVCHALAELLVRNNKNHYIGLETSYKWLEENSGAKKRMGRPPDLVRGGARVDVVLLNKNRQPIYIFEIKRSWNAYSAWTDGLRICTALDRFGSRHGGSLMGGLFGVFNVRPPNARQTEAEVEINQSSIMQELSPWDFKINHRRSPIMHGDSDRGIWSCQGVCFSFH